MDTSTVSSPEAVDTELSATDVAGLVGDIAAGEFASARESYRPQLLAWLKETIALEDQEFFDAAASAIHGSTLVMQFKGNWEHEHFKASAVYAIANQRHQAAGHTPECRGDNMYSRAWNRVARESGHPGMADQPKPCDCRQAATS